MLSFCYILCKTCWSLLLLNIHINFYLKSINSPNNHHNALPQMWLQFFLIVPRLSRKYNGDQWRMKTSVRSVTIRGLKSPRAILWPYIDGSVNEVPLNWDKGICDHITVPPTRSHIQKWRVRLINRVPLNLWFWIKFTFIEKNLNLHFSFILL